jgi:hypothetical protein
MLVLGVTVSIARGAYGALSLLGSATRSGGTVSRRACATAFEKGPFGPSSGAHAHLL